MGDKNPKKLKKKKQPKTTPTAAVVLPVETNQKKGRPVKNKQ